ncbi:MAG: polysaccharide deacetylase family protein [Bacteroidales bacterium]|nr:polysaccharide deacetylase family protein [Bacteroidales bacterium]
MLNYRNTNIFFFILLAVLIIAKLFLFISILFYLALFLIYIAIIAVGSIYIRLNFYLKSECSKITDEKVIALTFDDGPSEYTPQILDILNEYQVKAAFFCIGNKIDGNENILKRMDAEGHIMGNHSYTHHFWLDLFSGKKITDELENTESKIFEVINKKVKLFRPPYGVTNPNIKKAIANKNYTSIGWSVKSHDTIKNGMKILKHIKKELKPGAVFLMHDTNNEIISVLKEFIGYTIENNYKIIRLDELLNVKAYA